MVSVTRAVIAMAPMIVIVVVVGSPTAVIVATVVGVMMVSSASSAVMAASTASSAAAVGVVAAMIVAVRGQRTVHGFSDGACALRSSFVVSLSDVLLYLSLMSNFHNENKVNKYRSKSIQITTKPKQHHHHLPSPGPSHHECRMHPLAEEVSAASIVSGHSGGTPSQGPTLVHG